MIIQLKKRKTILAIASIILLYIFSGCGSSNDNLRQEKPEPNLTADREAPLGWVYLKTYPDSTFEFILTGLRDRDVYSGTYKLNQDTILFTYTDSIPKLNSFKAVVTEKSVHYLEGTYSESLEIRKNNLLVPQKKAMNETPVISPYQAELNNALANPEIEDYYKQVFQQKKLLPEDDNKMLSITDSLFTTNPQTDLFYFMVFTRSMNGSDGFYSEAVGLSAFNFVNQHTEQFADYFNIAPGLDEKDMDNWANFIHGEIQISKEGKEEKAVQELESTVFENLKGARKEYKPVMENLIQKIRNIHNLNKN